MDKRRKSYVDEQAGRQGKQARRPLLPRRENEVVGSRLYAVWWEQTASVRYEDRPATTPSGAEEIRRKVSWPDGGL